MALRQIMFAKNIEAAEQKLKDLRDKDEIGRAHV